MARTPVISDGEIASYEKLLGVMRWSFSSQRVREGRILVAAGDKQDAVYFIAKGAVSECDPYGTELGVLGPDHFFGESYVLQKMPSPCMYKTMTPCELIVLTTSQLSQLLSMHQSAHSYIMKLSRCRLTGKAAPGDSSYARRIPSPMSTSNSSAAFATRPLDLNMASAPTPIKPVATASRQYSRQQPQWGAHADQPPYGNIQYQRQISQHSATREGRHYVSEGAVANILGYDPYNMEGRTSYSPAPLMQGSRTPYHDAMRSSPALPARFSPSPVGMNADFDRQSPTLGQAQFALPQNRQLRAADHQATHRYIAQTNPPRDSFGYVIQSHFPANFTGSRSPSVHTTTTTISASGYLPLTKHNLDQLGGGESSPHGSLTLQRYLLEQQELCRRNAIASLSTESRGGPIFPPHRLVPSPRRAPYYVPHHYAAAHPPEDVLMVQAVNQTRISPDDMRPRGAWTDA